MGTKKSDVPKQVKKEYYEFQDSKNKKDFQIEIKNVRDFVQIPGIFDADMQNIFMEDGVKIIGFFPSECSKCVPMFAHLSNLVSRIKLLQVIILNETETKEIRSYKDFFTLSSSQLYHLIAMNGSFTFLLDSLKRKLNIEIRDFKAPFFLLLNSDNMILRSYEGVILEEIFEKDILDMLANTQEDSRDNED